MKGYCFLSAVPMRKEASDRAEMVNQLVLADTVEVVEHQEKWSLVRCEYDGYEGWVDNRRHRLLWTYPDMLQSQWYMASARCLTAGDLWRRGVPL